MATKKINEVDFMRRVRASFKADIEAWQECYDEMVEDLEFVNGDQQWPTAIKAQREADDRPCLTINKLPQFVDRVLGDMRQARPSIKVRPMDDIADPETADIMSGIIRNIEMQSDAEIVYDSGGEAMVRCGFGAWRVITDYVDDRSFDQEVRLERIKNQFGVVLDPAAKRWDRSDGRRAFIYEDIPRETFKKRWPKASPIPFDGGDNDLNEWVTEDTIRVAEYFEKDTETSKLYLVHITDQVGFKTVDKLPDEPHTVIKERQVESDKITWYRVSGTEILEGPIELKGKFIPIVPAYGKELNIRGKSYYHGIVRYAKDSMRMYNYFRSMDVETIALAPRAPWVMTADMLGPYRNMWKQANKRNFSYLLYVPDPSAPGAKPERSIPQMANQAIMQNIMVADQELHDTTGLQLASLGKKSNEQSGKAIQARAEEGSIGQFTYVDNLVRAIKYTAKIIIDLVPYIYDNARVQRIIGEDGEPQNVPINQTFEEEGKGGEKSERLFDLTAGKYDVAASVGPSYQTQRQESLAAMIDLARILEPNQRAIIAPSIVATSDWHGADKIAKHLKKTLPPGTFEEDTDEEPRQPTDAEMQAQALQQAQAEAEVEKLEVEIATMKEELKKAEADTAKAEAEAAIAEAKATAVAQGFQNPLEMK